MSGEGGTVSAGGGRAVREPPLHRTGARAPTRGCPYTGRGARFLPAQERRREGHPQGDAPTPSGGQGSCLRRNDGGKGTHKGCPYTERGARFLPAQERRREGHPQGMPLHRRRRGSCLRRNDGGAPTRGCPYTGRGARFLPPQERRREGHPQGDAPTPDGGRGSRLRRNDEVMHHRRRRGVRRGRGGVLRVADARGSGSSCPWRSVLPRSRGRWR